MIRIKRIYEVPDSSDGVRVLVDRLWPRGISKARASLDYWMKEVAPSPGLRIWFNHEPEKFPEFRAKYADELRRNPAVAQLQAVAGETPTVTLLYGAKDPVVNHAAVLRDFLDEKL